MKNIKLYDIHGPSTIENFKTLITPDNKYFYWDSYRFKRNVIGDIVFWVNRDEKTVLYTELDSTSVQPTYKDGKNLVSDMGYNVFALSEAPDQFEMFYRFKVLDKKNIPDGWNYSNPSPFNSQTMAIILYEPKFNEPEKKISKIKDLTPIFSENPEVMTLLNDAIKLLSSNTNSNIKMNFANEELKSKNSYNSIITAIKTKPFILLVGLSGTGKSRLVRTLAFKTCGKKELQTNLNKPGNFELISVRPNWHDSTELLGYVSRINGEKYIATSFLKFLANAWNNLDTPFFLCLDEMNLAPVEQYFAEYLSIIETRALGINGEICTDYILPRSTFDNSDLYNELLSELKLDKNNFEEGISIPKNLIVMGTVNMDETTHSFSRKVLDRAMTFEMNDVNLNSVFEPSEKDWAYPDANFPLSDIVGNFTEGIEVVKKFSEAQKIVNFLIAVNEKLNNTPFKIAYRVRDEFLIYCYYRSQMENKNKNWLDEYLDQMTSMKILSRIEGDENRTKEVLENLSKIFNSNYVISNSKIEEMKSRLDKTGYTSYWL